ncbi:Lipoprotein, putative (fragment) [Listeria monocytogenes]
MWITETYLPTSYQHVENFMQHGL